MGYFSNLALEKEEQSIFEDYSYPSPEKQLQWRIEDLLNRLEELYHSKFSHTISILDDCRLSNTDIEYALPECLTNVDDIITAIAIAKYKLRLASDEYQCEPPEAQEKDDVIPGQITIWEYIEIEKKSTGTSLFVAA